MDYRVELDVYNGPLDLLLYLIKRDELDIYDIPISRITDTYMSYVNMLRQMSTDGGLDINIAGDFLVMAATLMEVKSAMLLPRQPEEAGVEGSVAQELADPRYELVQKLLEYKRFKDAASTLQQRQDVHQQRFKRAPARLPGQADEAPPLDMDEVQVWDLLETFSRLMREVGSRLKVHEVVYDDTPIDLHAADIEDRLAREGVLSLRQLLAGRTHRSEMIGIFLALLELIREKKILVTQTETLGDLEIVAAPEEHRKTYEHASLHLSEEAAPAPAPAPTRSSDDSLSIRVAQPQDAPAIRRVNEAAFGRVGEADLVEALDTSGRVVASLVATLPGPGEQGGEIVGHILFSRITLDCEGQMLEATALAPVSVLPAHQRRGIGSALIRQGIEVCREAGHGLVIVLGHPEYYPRFGFNRADLHDIRCELDVPPEAFMMLELMPGAGRPGVIRYPVEFSAV